MKVVDKDVSSMMISLTLDDEDDAESVTVSDPCTPPS